MLKEQLEVLDLLENTLRIPRISRDTKNYDKEEKKAIRKSIEEMIKEDARIVSLDVKGRVYELIEYTQELKDSGNLEVEKLLHFICNNLVINGYCCNGEKEIEEIEEIGRTIRLLHEMPIWYLVYIAYTVRNAKLKLQRGTAHLFNNRILEELEYSTEINKFERSIKDLLKEAEKEKMKKAEKLVDVECMSEKLKNICPNCGKKLTSTGQCTNMCCCKNTIKQ